MGCVRKKRKKSLRQSLTLLEVMIALSLTSVMLFFLFGFFREITVKNHEAEKIQEKFFSQEKAHMRLSGLFSEFLEFSDAQALLYTDVKEASPSLLGTFYAPVDADPLFSGALLATLYLSRKGALELEISPLGEEGKSKKETLLENIQEIAFSFFDLEKKVWKDKWEKGSSRFPAMIQITLTQKNKEPKLHFAFFLSSAQTPPVFKT